MRERIAPRFDITPEFLTHLSSYDLKTGNYRRHMYEDTWITQASKEEIVTHWQSLYTQGTELGLEELTVLAERIQKVFGSSFEWVKCSEMARRYVESQT